MPDDYTVGELARAVASAVSRIETIAARLEGGQFVGKNEFELTKENFTLTTENLRQAIERIEKSTASTQEAGELDKRIEQLEDTNKWIIRLVGAFIILAVLGYVFSTGQVPQ